MADGNPAGGAMAAEMCPASIDGTAFPQQLFLWLSPAFPVGAFAYSHGLEWAAADARISDAATLQAWLSDLLSAGSLRNDLILLSNAWRAARADDLDCLRATAELALALQPSAERYLESSSQGRAFMLAVRRSWPCALFDRLPSTDWDDVAYPVAVAIAAAGHGIQCGPTLNAYGLAFLGNLVSAAIRLSVIGHTDGQSILAALAPALEAEAGRAAFAGIEAIGGATFISDIASMLHETQTTRLFRT